MVLVLFLSSVIFTQLIPLIFIFLIQMPIVAIAKIHREWVKSIKGALFLAIIIFSTNLLSFYFFSGRILTTENVEYALSLTIRFLALVTSFSVFFLTTSPDDLSLALEKARIPFEFNFAFITAIRFVPVLADEAQSIIDAQRSRGLELDKGNFLSRIRKYIPILLPLIINSIRRSLELAEAMESRAFGATSKRTNLFELKLQKMDYGVLAMVILALIASFYIRFYFPPIGPIFPSKILIG